LDAAAAAAASFNTDTALECRLEVGGWYSVVSMCGYWGSAVLICCLPHRAEPCFGNYCCQKKKKRIAPPRAQDDESEIFFKQSQKNLEQREKK
jgi:hypothetical protein